MDRITNDTVSGGRPLDQRFEQLGKLSWLWTNSSLHREWGVEVFARFLIPPITLGQIEILERNGMPVAYCSWAWLSEAAEIRYMLDPSDIRVEDWTGGDRLWFADWVAPFAAADSWHLRSIMAARFPNEVARAIRVKRGSKTARVMEFKGSQLPAAIAHERLKQYYEGFMNAASSFVSNDRNADPQAPASFEATPSVGRNPDAVPVHRLVG